MRLCMIAHLGIVRHTTEEKLSSQGKRITGHCACIAAEQRCCAVETPRPRPPSVKAYQTEANAQLGGQNSYTAIA